LLLALLDYYVIPANEAQMAFMGHFIADRERIWPSVTGFTDL
jgi:hypothetical protein